MLELEQNLGERTNGTEELTSRPRPVLRVHDKFEALDDYGIGYLFWTNGYHIEVGGSHDFSNPLEFSIDVSSSSRVPTPIERGEIASTTCGIPLPLRLALPETLKSFSPVVVKDTLKNRGENKFLLETPEQKYRFAMWMLHVQRFDSGNEEFYRNPGYIARLRREVQSGTFYFNTGANPPWNSSWVHEEFIEAPGDVFSSFRIVVDSYGNVHYGQVTKSAHSKDSPVTVTDQPRIPNPLVDPLDPNHNTSLLTEPNSPFYLGSRNIVSNVAAGGTALLLNGNPVMVNADRNLLVDLGMDPDNPQIPEELVSASEKIGTTLRQGIPFMGIDFMRRRDNGQYVLLEVNTGPLLRPEVFGEQPGVQQHKLYYKMYERIIRGAQEAHPTAFS